MSEILHSKIYAENHNGVPLLVFHGLFGMLDNWVTFAKELSEYCPVHIIDLRNHGKSFHSEQMSHDLMAEDILNYVKHYNLEKINLLGHSLGGKAVMKFALLYGEKIQNLVVADIAPKAYPPHHQAIIKALESVDFQKVNKRAEVEEVLNQYIKEKSVVQFLMKSLYWESEGKLTWKFNLKTLSARYGDLVSVGVDSGEFQGETLFLAGEKSQYILPEDKEEILKLFPKAEIKKIKNAGHWIHAENPKDFMLEIKQFLNF